MVSMTGLSILLVVVISSQAQQISRNPCLNFTCLNGGTCTSPLDYPYCLCPAGFNGTKCETKLPAAKCPLVNSQSFGVCGGVFCGSDSDCTNGQICCQSDCGSNLCTYPVTDVQQTVCLNGCPKGSTCELRPRQCSPGMMCTQDMVPTCVSQTDQCGGCPEGTFCKDTGLRCITEPCPTFQCVAVDACGGCPLGQKCNKLYPPCARPPPCDEDSLEPCVQPVCQPIDTCVPDETTDFPIDECGNCPSGQVCKPTGIVCIRAPCPTHKCVAVTTPTPAVCNLACRRGYVCRLQVPTCPKTSLRCSTKPVPTCVPQQKQLASCPKPAQNQTRRTCFLQQLRRQCFSDRDCSYSRNERCCPGPCGNSRQCTVVQNLP